MSDTLASLFTDKKLYELALTHRSSLNENPNRKISNERLEFLGDAVLEFVVSHELYSQFPDKGEGYLTALRANLVNTVNLAVLAQKLEIGGDLILSKGEEDGGGRENVSLLANTVEALIGALYLDRGVRVVYKFIKDNIISSVPEKTAQPLKDPKSLLQEYIQAQGKPAPKYQVVEETGPDHNKHFVIEVIVDNEALAVGTGKNKSQGEQEAAKQALASIQQ